MNPQIALSFKDKFLVQQLIYYFKTQLQLIHPTHLLAFRMVIKPAGKHKPRLLTDC